MTRERKLRFLFTTWEGGGNVGPALTVARKLRQRGHSVTVLSDRCNRLEVEAIGARFAPWTRAPSRPDRSKDSDVFRDWEVDSPQEQIGRLIDRIMAGPSLAYALDTVEELSRNPADLVVSSEMLFGVMIGCESIGQKHVLLSANINLFSTPGVPPMGPGLLPAANAEDGAFHMEIAEANRQLFDAGLPPVNAGRAKLGLLPLQRFEDQLQSAERLLLGTSRAFDFAPAETPPNILYIGPQLDDPAWAGSWHSPWNVDDRRPLILVAFSTSFQDHVGVLQRIISAASKMPVRLLVTLGATVSKDELSASENCRLVKVAPHNAVMAEAAFVITHGGHGTVTRALIHRRPLIVVPHGRDQNDNAARVVARGAGLMLHAQSTVDQFCEAISRMLAEPSFAASARTLGDRVAEEAAQSPVVTELEDMASGGHCNAALQAA